MAMNQAALKTAAAAKSMSAAARALKNVSVSDLPKSSAQRDSRVRNAYAQRDYVQSKAEQALADRQATEAFLFPIMAQGEAQAGNGAAAMNLSNKATQAVRANAENILAADWLSGISSNVLNSRFAAVPELFGTLLDASKPETLWENSDKVYKSDADAKAVDFKNPTFFVPEQGDKPAVGLTGSLKGDPFANVANREWTILDESAIKALDTTAFGKKEAELPEVPNLSKGFYEASDRMSRQAAADIQRAYDAVGDTALGRTLTDVVAASAGMATDTFLGMGAGSMPSIILNGFASGAREARYAGADADTAMLAGIASAAVSYGTEHISGLGLGQLTGVNGTLDEVTKRAISRAVNRVGNTVGKSVLNTTLQIIVGGLGEGFEEVLEAVLDPLVQRIYKEGPLKESYSNEFLSEMLYDGLIGAITGLLGNGLAQVQSFGSDKAGYEGVERMLNGTATEQDAINVLQSEAAMRQFERSVGVKPTAFATIEDMLLAALEVGDARETARLKKNNVPYTAEQVRNIKREGKTFKNLIVNIDTKVSDFFNKWKNGRKSHQNEKLEKLYIGTLSDSLKPQISSIVGYDVGDRDFIITNDDVRHIFDHHGDAKKEVSRGNLPLDTISFDALLDVVAEPTRVYRGAFEHGKPGDRAGIVFEKKFENGRVVYIQFDNKGRHTLQGKTMYIKPAANTTSVVNASSETNTFTPKTAEPVSTAGANNILHPNVENKGNLGVAQKNIAPQNNSQDNKFFDWLLDVKNREMPPRREIDNGEFAGYNKKRSDVLNEAVRRLSAGENYELDRIMASPEMVEAERENESTPTIELPNREGIRQEAYAKAMRRGSWNGRDYSGPVRQERRMDIVLGLPGSGKSSVYTEPLSQKYGSRVIDTDDYRADIPEYNGTNATVVHEEASYIKKQALKAALDNGDNILLSIVGDNAEKLLREIRRYNLYDYSVYLHLNELTNAKAIGRAINRYVDVDGNRGRYINPQMIASYGDKPTQTYLYLTGQGGEINGNIRALAGGLRESGQSGRGIYGAGGEGIPGEKGAAKLAGYDWYNNDVEYGQPPKLIQSSEVTSPKPAGGRTGGSENNKFFDWLLDVKNREMPPRREIDNGFLERILGGVQQAGERRQGGPLQVNNVDNTAKSGYSEINRGGYDDAGGKDIAANEAGVFEDISERSRTNNKTGISGVQQRAGAGYQGWTGFGSVPVNSGFVLLSEESRQVLNERGVVNVELHNNSADNAAFSAALDEARATDVKNGWAVTPKTMEELAKVRTFMDEKGTTGFAIAEEGDIEAVFANKMKGAPKGATQSTIPQAIANGGMKLDCYGEQLVRIYAKHGFIPVARVAFNPEYANEGWTPGKGAPDIYFMMHNGDGADTVVRNYGQYKMWTKRELDALPLMEYDDAYAYRDLLLDSLKQTTAK